MHVDGERLFTNTGLAMVKESDNFFQNGLLRGRHNNYCAKGHLKAKNWPKRCI